MTLYLNFETVEQLDAEYDTSRYVSDVQSLFLQRREWSEAALNDLPHKRNVPYGAASEERLDIFPAEAPDSPIVVFIHGGYWSTPELVKDLYSWTARGLRAHGLATAVIDYGVCPHYSVGDLVRQSQNAVAWLHANASSFGASPSKIYVVGHSAGAHMGAMLALTDWPSLFGLPKNTIKGISAISGLYDLRPFPHTWLQSKLRLTQDEVERNSPLTLLETAVAPMLILYGSMETEEFHRQAAAMEERCLFTKTDVAVVALSGCSHNSAIDGLADAESTLCRVIARHVRTVMDLSLADQSSGG